MALTHGRLGVPLPHLTTAVQQLNFGQSVNFALDIGSPEQGLHDDFFTLGAERVANSSDCLQPRKQSAQYS